MTNDTSPAGLRWLLLIHQLPTKPAYFRVKIWRRRLAEDPATAAARAD